MIRHPLYMGTSTRVCTERGSKPRIQTMERDYRYTTYINSEYIFRRIFMHTIETTMGTPAAQIIWRIKIEYNIHAPCIQRNLNSIEIARP